VAIVEIGASKTIYKIGYLSSDRVIVTSRSNCCRVRLSGRNAGKRKGHYHEDRGQAASRL
jgi:hypothetical protein